MCYSFIMKELKENLKTLRIAEGKTQERVAKEVGISRSAYSNYEQGLREPYLATLKKLCVYFQVSADYLLGLED